MIVNNNEFHHEEWESFGKYIDQFIKDNEEALKQDSFDIILGFTRGGHIIATILSCLLRDCIDEYNSEQHKASLRPIPRGITTKRYREPCFVMHDAASKEDVDDLRQLKMELYDFSRRIKKDQINVLLVDDNLTGSSRLSLIMDELKNEKFINIRSLAYVRHPDFFTPHLDYTIRDFPDGKLFFVMPYHKEAKKAEIKQTQVDERISLVVNLKNGVDIPDLMDKIKSLNNFTRTKHVSTPDYELISIKRGESAMVMFIRESTMEIYNIPHKVYPPKDCLKNNYPAFKSSLCQYGVDPLEAKYCVLCSFLNCNKDILESILELDTTKRVITIVGREGRVKAKIRNVAKLWLVETFGIEVSL